MVEYLQVIVSVPSPMGEPKREFILRATICTPRFFEEETLVANLLDEVLHQYVGEPFCPSTFEAVRECTSRTLSEKLGCPIVVEVLNDGTELVPPPSQVGYQVN